MPQALCLPDNKGFDIEVGETILAATLRAGIPHAHACGGQAKCSTCRIWILDGLEACETRTEAELALAEPLGFGPEIRLACQAKVSGDVRFRRLVLDEADLEITSQLARKHYGSCGESKNIVVLFCDIRDFTGFSEFLSSYDVMFVLNRYFYQMGEIIERNGGYIDAFIGDEIMALFGIEDDENAPLRGVKSALEMLDVVDNLKPYMEAMYGRSFDVGVGLHYGEAVIGTIGSANKEKLTAIGTTVNVASRIEAANKDAGTRLLISEELYERVKDDVVMQDFLRVKLRGTSERKTLYEISGLFERALADLPAATEAAEDSRRYAGLDWVKLIKEAELPVGARKVIERKEIDIQLIRTEARIFAFNNACPHLNLPLNDSEITEDGAIVCRWHQSHFDLATGEVRKWCDGLQGDGTSKGQEHLGNISKNKRPMTILPVRIEDGNIWVALD